MSFNIEFYSTKREAIAIMEEETAPDSVKNFIHKALTAFNDKELVHVKAQGHLYNNDYTCSTANIMVNFISLRHPKNTS